MKKLSLINKIIYILNSFFAIILLISYLLPYLSPETIAVVAILSLFVPAFILINIVFVCFWILNLKKQFMLSASILLIGWFILPSIYELSKSDTSSKDDLKIMSYNVRTFNHWKWINTDSIPTKIHKFITQKSPDIVLFQEYYTEVNQTFNYQYKYVKTKNKKDKIGLAIFSKYPIINSGSLELQKTSNNIIFADIIKKKDTIRIYNLHLQSLQLKTDKENFGQENSEKLLTILKDGFKKQANQTAIFLAHEKKWKGKKIIAGDFNNTSFSWVYNQISKDKKDAFLESGNGFGETFNYWFPMRIDFILTDENASIHQFDSFLEKNSDHYPIMAKINW